MSDFDAKEYERVMAERLARKAAYEAEKALQKKREQMVLASLEEEHGEGNIKDVWTVGGLVVITSPTGPAFQRYRDMVYSQKASASLRSRAASDLAKPFVIYPDAKGYEALCTRYPGIQDTVGLAAVKFAGSAEEDEAGK